MKQKLLLILICLFGMSHVDAQFSAIPARTGTQLRTTTDGLLYFGYCDDDIQNGVGVSETAELSAAICVPASMSNLYAGKTITKIRIGLNANCTKVSVWIRNSLTGANLVLQTVGNANQGWTEVTLNTPFTIPTNDFYIGYTATGNFHVGFSGNPDANGCWLWYNGWGNYVGNNWGSLCLQALIDAKGETILALDPQSLPKIVRSSLNQNFTIDGSVRSFSSVDITSVKVVYQIDNQIPVEHTIQTSIAPMKTGAISLPISAMTSGIYQLSLKIPEINGQTNVFADKSLKAEIRIPPQFPPQFPRKVVMEEGTGTWCGWCTRGVVGMALMKEKYPDTYIGIAVHNGDPMTVKEYDNYMTANFINGFPGAVIDRKTELICDPYPDDLYNDISGSEKYFLSEMAKMPIASIQLTGGFVDAGKKAIVLKTVTTFGVSSNNAYFKLAYVLIENGITGYTQENFYAGGGSGKMGGYENKPASIRDMVYNDVARGIYSEPTGIPGSIPASVTEMAPIEHTCIIDLPASIKNVNQLEVVVMLLSASSGEIENADKIEIDGVYSDLPAVSTGVNVNAYVKNQNLYIESRDTETIDIYTVSGKKVFNVTKTSGIISVFCGHLPDGLLIVKGSSGWVKKVVNH